MFPEIDYDKVDRDLGHGHHRLHHARKTDDEARALLDGFNFPFRQ